MLKDYYFENTRISDNIKSTIIISKFIFQLTFSIRTMSFDPLNPVELTVIMYLFSENLTVKETGFVTYVKYHAIYTSSYIGLYPVKHLYGGNTFNK